MTDHTLSPPAPPKYRSRTRSALRFLLQRVLFRGLVRSAITPTVSIAPGVRELDRGFLVIANHTSHLDAPMIAQSLPRRQSRFLATGVAYDYFFTVWHKRLFVRWLFNAFPIYREGSRGSANLPRALLRSGVPVLLFPEGSRQKSGTIADFKAGSIKLAVDASVPIVPAAVVGGFEAMPKGAAWPAAGRPPVHVAFGEPVTARDEESLSELTARVRQLVAELFAAGADDIGVGSEHVESPERTKK
ncbi:lysophospholipid acyltransferase family protein [Brevibacterium sp. VCM10]|uniref:lysophospholipid acyltransferase family protein n=1 Tax=Brevibacterium sp. VCM10 TaxID=1381751 RepID=UPI0009DD8556|nr:lysophospholipid acyltransferase family protein [Brevibacterium sp. VCM10]